MYFRMSQQPVPVPVGVLAGNQQTSNSSGVLMEEGSSSSSSSSASASASALDFVVPSGGGEGGGGGTTHKDLVLQTPIPRGAAGRGSSSSGHHAANNNTISSSVDTPMTADISWSSADGNDMDNYADADAQPSLFPLDGDEMEVLELEQEEEQQEQERQNSITKMNKDKTTSERIKAKAIKAANKELGGGVDEERLAAVLGLSTTSSTGSSSNNNKKNKQQNGETDEMSEIRYFADSLGLPTSFFGDTTAAPAPAPAHPDSNSNSNNEATDVVPFKEPETTASISHVNDGDDSHHNHNHNHSNSNSNDEIEPQLLLSPASLPSGSAVVVVGGSGNNALPHPPGRKQGGVNGGEFLFKPQPVTVEQKRQHKEEAMSRLNRIKAKAIRSATKSLGVDENHLSAAVGMSLREVDEHQANKRNSNSNSNKTNNKTLAKREEESSSAEEIQYIADTLGLPVELFGVVPPPMTTRSSSNKSSKVNSTSPIISTVAHEIQPGSLASALLGIPMQVKKVESQIVDGAAQQETTPTTTSSLTKPATPDYSVAAMQAKSGSLAAALGMSVDDSADAPPVRQGGGVAAAAPATPKPMVMLEGIPPREATTPPKAGSLAAALGMQVVMDPSAAAAAAAAVRPRDNKESEVGAPAPGSLAAALGMSVGYARRTTTMTTTTKTTTGAGNPTTMRTTTTGVETPRPGSLAAALGLHVDSSDSVVGPGMQPPPHSSAQPCHGSLAEALGMKVAYNPPTKEQVRAGSLAAALGMSVDSSLVTAGPGVVVLALPDSGASLPSSRTPANKAQAGSLAAALGMSVERSSNEKSAWIPVQAEIANNVPCVEPRSLAAALGMRSTAAADDSSFSDTRGVTISNDYYKRTGPTTTNRDGVSAEPVAGSLAEALRAKTQIEPRLNPAQYGQKRDVGSEDDDSTTEDDNSDSDGSGSESSEDSNEESLEEYAPKKDDSSMAITQPQAGSLAAALGMAVSPADVHHGMIAQSATQPPALSSVNKSLFGRVFSSVVAMQAKSHEQMPAVVAGKPESGSLADALGLSLMLPQSKEAAAVDNNAVHRSDNKARPGSLAAALGMAVASPQSSHPPALARTQLDDKPLVAGSLADALGLAKSPTTVSSTNELLMSLATPVQTGKPLPGSLAAALGMSVSSPAPEMQTESSVQPQPGSLAAALGMSVASQTPAPAIAALSSTKGVDNKPRVGSLAAALGVPVTSDSRMPQQLEKPLAGSLAAALGVSVSLPQTELPNRSTVINEPIVQPRHRAGTLADALLGISKSSSPTLRSLPLVENLESTKAYTLNPSSDTEILLRVELAATKAEAAGAKAYGKAMEQQMAQLSQAFAGKLNELNEEIASYKAEIAEKSLEIESLEGEVCEERTSQGRLMGRLHQMTARLQQTRALMDETDSMLKQEFSEINQSRGIFQHQPSVVGGGGTPSSRTRDIQRILEREGNRRESMKARLTAMRASSATN